VTHPQPRRRPWYATQASLGGLATPAVLLVAWLVAAHFLPYAVATPAETMRAIVRGFERGWMQAGLATTLAATGLAFIVSTVLGVAFSLAVALSRFWGDVWEPVLVWLYSVPKIVLYPVVMLAFGISLEASVAFGVINAVLPVAIITFGAIRAVPATLLKVARSYGLGRGSVFREVVLPVALPSRYAFSISFLAVVVGEMLASRQGIGQELFKAIALNDIARIFGIALVLTLIAVAVNSAFLVFQRVAFGGRK